MKNFKMILIGISFFMILSGCNMNQTPKQTETQHSTPEQNEMNNPMGEEAKKNEQDSIHETTNHQTPLPIPPLLEDQNPAENIAEFQLKAQKSTKVFLNGIETETYGYNGDFLTGKCRN